jgi:hypothetical protein
VATLSVRNRVSREDTVELIEELFGARISSGTVDAILTRTGQALAEPHDDLLRRLRAAQALNMDETGWRTAGERRALWGNVRSAPCLLRYRARSARGSCQGAVADTTAIVTSDRWWAYAHLPVKRRQLCWAHLRRDFTAHAEGLAAEKQFGEIGLELCERVFWAWTCPQRQRSGQCSMTSSTAHAGNSGRPWPSWPSCAPRLRPDESLLCDGEEGGSELGGAEEFREERFSRRSSSAIRSPWRATHSSSHRICSSIRTRTTTTTSRP